MEIDVICTDVLDWAAETEPIKAHAILCDPSYALSRKKRLDTAAPVDAEIKTVGDLIAAYHSLQQWGDTGFMNRQWDDSTAFNPETWRLLAKHLLPGGFIMAFASTRGNHRMATAMEDAGLVIHPTIFCYGVEIPSMLLWVQGQGFCKATNIHAQLEKTLCYPKDGKWYYKSDNEPMRIKPPFRYGDEADRFFGHRYGGQCLAPKVEPIIVAQKPYDGKPVDSIVETGAGALWIDGGRVGVNSNDPNRRRATGDINGEPIDFLFNNRTRGATLIQGRWPPNFALSHVPDHYRCRQCHTTHPMQPVIEVCPDCGGELEWVEGCKRVGVKRVKGNDRPNIAGQDGNTSKGFLGERGLKKSMIYHADPDGLETVSDWRCSENCPVAELGEQAGERKSAGRYLRPDEVKERPTALTGKMAGDELRNSNIYANETGNASRFYPQSDFSHEIAEQIAVTSPVRYQPKSPKRERNQGLDDFYWRRDKSSPSGFMRVSREEWGELPKRERARGNIHVSVKPLGLLKWLASLLLPPGEYAPRRLLVPFCGSGSEVVAASLIGFEEVVGIDFIQDYVDISRARVNFWKRKPRQKEMSL